MNCLRFKKIFVTFLILLLTTTVLSLINIQPVKAIEFTQAIYIKADGSIYPSQAPIQKNNNIYTLTNNISQIYNQTTSHFPDGIIIEKDNIILDGKGYVLKTARPEEASSPITIIISNRNNITIRNLQIEGGHHGTTISNSTNITLSNNNMLRAYGMTLELNDCSNCRIINNTIGHITWGTEFQITNSNNNLIIENMIEGHLICMYIKNSSSNQIYHNSFLPISHFTHGHISVMKSDFENNVWDNGYPSGGNYWGSWNNTDIAGNGTFIQGPYWINNFTDIYHGPYQNITGSDGIGDTPYIPKLPVYDGTDASWSNNTDKYPLMGPFSRFDFDVKLDEIIEPFSVKIYSNSTVKDFASNKIDKILSFNVNGNDGVAGFCRIIIPNILVENLWNNDYKILLDRQEVSFTNTSDNDFTYIYVNYTHSTHTITIIPTIVVPEFSSTLILPLFITLTLLISIIYFKKPCLVTH